MNSSRRVVHLRVRPLRAVAAAAAVAAVLAGCSATNPATIATPFDPADGRNAQIGGETGNGGGDGNYQGNGGIKLRDFLLVSQGGQGQPGVVVGVISNDTGQPTQVALTVAATGSDGQAQQLGTTTISLPAGAFVQLGNPAAASGTGGASGVTAGPTSSGGSSSPGGSASNGGTAPSAARPAWFQVTNVQQPAGTVLQLFARTPSGGGATLDLPILPPVAEYAAITPTTAPATTPPAPSATGSPTTAPTPQPTANPSGAAHQPTPSASSSS